MNFVFLTGRITKDPELKTNQNNNQFCNFSIAVDKPFKQGEDRQADFFNCTVWNKTAEYFYAYAKKGSKVAVKGSIGTYQRESNGVSQTHTSINVNELEILDKKKEKVDGPNTATIYTRELFNEAQLVDDSDLPF